MFEINSTLRELAKSNYWQTLYSSSKEMAGIKIFKNELEFTKLQVEFLNYLSFYYSLNIDIYVGEVDRDIVSKSFIREDAYMYYKSKKKDKPEKDNKPDQGVRDTWVFPKAHKKE